MIVDISKEDLEGLKIILNEFSKKEFNTLINAIKSLPNEIDPDNLYEVLEKTNLKKPNIVTRITFKLLFSFTRKQLSVEKERIAELFFQNFIEKGGEADKKIFIARFITIISASNSIQNAFELAIAKHNSGNYIENIELSLDVKPIFTGNNKSNLLGTLFINKLKLSFLNEEEEEKEIIFSLDRKRLNQLKNLIEQVEKNGELLADELSKTNIKIIE